MVESAARQSVPSLVTRIGKLELQAPTVIGSVAGFAVDDYAYVTERLAARDEIDAIELNISCPNVGSEGETFACDPALADAATRAARGVTGKPLIVKLSPNVTDIAAIARIVEAAGAD